MEETKQDTNEEVENPSNQSLLFLRQIFACSPMITNFLILGLYMGAPTVIIPQMKKESNSEYIITPEMATWFSCMSSLCSFPWTIILPLIANRYGRKASLLLVNINTIIGTIIFCYSKTFTQLIISQVMIGTVMGSVFTISVMIFSEFASPRYRGMILTLTSRSFFWGILISHFLGTILHWKIISYIIFACCTYNSLKFPESPYWLASKRRFQECAKNHRWINKTDPNCENELHILISIQKTHLNNISTNDNETANNVFIGMHKIITRKKFYKPLFYALLTICLYYFSGKLAFSIYANDIIKNITSNEKTHYEETLILDGITIFCAYVGCCITHILKRRTQLLLFLAFGIFFLYLLCIYSYIIKLNIMYENIYIYLLLSTGFSISFSCGPLILAMSFLSELIPLQDRKLFLIITGIFSSLVLAIILKITPAIYTTYGCHVIFLFYAMTASVCLFCLYKHLPETKNRAIQETEDFVAEEEEEQTSAIEDIKEPIPLKSIS